MAIFGRTLTIVFVVVPFTTGRVFAIHQVIEASSLPAVEIFHLETLAVTGPAVEFHRMTQKLIAGHRNSAKILDQTSRSHRVWFGDTQFVGRKLAPMCFNSRSHGWCVAVVDLKALAAQFFGKRGHGS